MVTIDTDFKGSRRDRATRLAQTKSNLSVSLDLLWNTRDWLNAGFKNCEWQMDRN
jgi:hypothetical protein